MFTVTVILRSRSSHDGHGNTLEFESIAIFTLLCLSRVFLSSCWQFLRNPANFVKKHYFQPYDNQARYNLLSFSVLSDIFML
jgi:hypothetical protein